MPDFAVRASKIRSRSKSFYVGQYPLVTNERGSASSLSHEVRTPLNCVIGMASVLSGDSSLSPVQAESIRMIVTSGELLMAIADDVLVYSRLANGNIDIVAKRSNLQDTLSATIHSANLIGAARGVTVNPQYDITVPECINADMRRVSQVLYNILGNAIKYSREGKTVDLHVSICSAGDVQSASTTRYSPRRVKNGQPLPDLKGCVLRLIVRDWGIGIRAEDFEKIFQPFSLIEEEAEMPHGGSGLGLSTTAKVVHALGGSISVDSVQDHWTTITVELPFNEAPVDTRMLASRLERTTVLLVGCDANERERMATIFGSLPVQFACLDDLLALKDTIHTDSEGVLVKDRSFVFLVHEDVHDRMAYGLLSWHRKAILFTFGPNFKVEESCEHFRSLTQVLPSVLLSRMAERVEPPKPSSPNVLRRTSSSDVSSVPEFHSLRCLLAEDNIINQEVLTRILLRLGIENVEIVENGAMAVQREKAEPFDVVFMDTTSPKYARLLGTFVSLFISLTLLFILLCKSANARHVRNRSNPSHYQSC